LNDALVDRISKVSDILDNVDMIKWSDRCDQIIQCKVRDDYYDILEGKVDAADHAVIFPNATVAKVDNDAREVTDEDGNAIQILRDVNRS
jgi:hypothetical protein